MQGCIKFANRLRLDLAIEIQQLASCVRRVTQVAPNGPVDVTERALAVAQERFTMLQGLITALGTRSEPALRPPG